MASITQYLEIYTKEYLLNMALQQVPEDVDTRQGSIIYDTLAITCTKLADVFMEVKQIADQAYMPSATKKENIDYKAAERGVYRYEATKAERLGTFTYSDGTPASIPVGSLFCTIDENKENVINYIVTAPYILDDIEIKGSYVLECQVDGTIGNTYFGEILPLTDMDTLGSATLTTVLTPARDEESSESVKQRYYDTFNIEAFGGNIADYKDYMSKFTGVGQRQIYPRTKDDKRIIISCVDPSNQPISQEYQNTIKQTLDPENYYNNGNNTSGLGLGVVPIGHYPVVTTPNVVDINIDIEIIVSPISNIDSATEQIRNNISGYIAELQDTWDNGEGEYSVVAYYNKIFALAEVSQGVANVRSCLVNGGTDDIDLIQNRDQQNMPRLGTLTVSEVQ